MSRKSLGLARFVSLVVVGMLMLNIVLFGPASHAYANGPETVLFRAEFESAPLGPLSTPLLVETGTVVPQTGANALVALGSGHALQLDSGGGQATALMQWSNYPGAIPTTSQGTLSVRIVGSFTTSISTTTSASLNLLAGASMFELFSFGAGGVLTRAGAPIGLSYAVSTTVNLDARLVLKRAAGSTAQIVLWTTSGIKSVSVALPSAFSAATLNQLQLSLPAGSGSATADHLLVTFSKGEGRLEPPPIIVIGDGDIEYEFEHIGGVLFISIKIVVLNTGGVSAGTYLILNLDDLSEFLDLDDIRFLIGVGFVAELDAHHVIIGLGQNNVIFGGDKVKVKIRFKAKKDHVDTTLKARFTLAFDSGDQNVAFSPQIGSVFATRSSSEPTVGVVQRLPLGAIDDRFVRMWRDKGGMDVFGLPISQPITLSSGVRVQYFERARLEYHPELARTPYAVMLGLLGVELGHRSELTIAAPASRAERAWYFSMTQHLIARPFRSFWRSHGGVAIFGMPIGEVMMEQGQVVQYFERARFELHPELSGTAYEVQLGHLGVQSFQAMAVNGS